MPKNIIVENADNEWLGPSPCGFVSEVNGPDAGEVPAFVPTRYGRVRLCGHEMVLSAVSKPQNTGLNGSLPRWGSRRSSGQGGSRGLCSRRGPCVVESVR